MPLASASMLRAVNDVRNARYRASILHDRMEALVQSACRYNPGVRFQCRRNRLSRRDRLPHRLRHRSAERPRCRDPGTAGDALARSNRCRTRSDHRRRVRHSGDARGLDYAEPHGRRGCSDLRLPSKYSRPPHRHRPRTARISTTSPSASGTPSVRTWDMNLPIWSRGKGFTTQSTRRPSSSSSA